MLCAAFPADAAVQSEKRRQEFTQTLTKTFADQSIGLAIFDRFRRLVLFNPALSDLTGLSSGFLTSRPALFDFLDRLREARVMPEPRDYRAWRKALAELEAGAESGTYSDTWTLPDGRTYRVAGRPHPDGAVALLLEDITAEMSLTRRFRAQIEQAQVALDVLDDAVAIFSATGEMTFSNRAYKELWEDYSSESPLGSTAVDATRRWHERTAPTPIWGDFREFVTQGRERSEWTAMVTHRDGRSVFCRFSPQKAGTTIAVFRPSEPTSDSKERLREAV